MKLIFVFLVVLAMTLFSQQVHAWNNWSDFATPKWNHTTPSTQETGRLIEGLPFYQDMKTTIDHCLEVESQDARCHNLLTLFRQ